MAQAQSDEVVTPAEQPDAVAQALLDHADPALIALDATHRILRLNHAAQRLLGVQAGKPRFSAEDCSNLASVAQTQFARLLGTQHADTLHLRSVAGLDLVVSAARNNDVLLISCGTRPPAAAADHLDALTGLADRPGFFRQLKRLCVGPAGQVAVLTVDLDRFKSVNDTLGHEAGDALLQLVAQRLRGMFRNADVVARLGGDEFAVAMIAGPEVVSIADRLVSVLSRPYLVERQAAVIGASVGIALSPQHGTDPTTLLRAADLALHQAKADGRGLVRVFNDELDQRTRTRHALADDLRRAIPLQQLALHFQPQLELGSGRLTGFEALVRWHHPVHGIVPPDRFIPIAEETGLILPLGEWVLREACRQAAGWPDHVSVAVNVSPKQLLDRERLPRAIAASLAASGLPAERLEVELTESALVREAEAIEVLNAVHALGVRVSMDDFGTGYSSLSQLRRFPFDKIKIDRSFVRDLGGSDEAGAVVRAIAALGKSLGMATIAEGVETADQAEMCRADGCTAMQGYLVSRPVPAGDVAGLIRVLSNTDRSDL